MWETDGRNDRSGPLWNEQASSQIPQPEQFSGFTTFGVSILYFLLA